MSYYFSPSTSPIITMVSNTKNTMPCPFSGRYRLAGTTQALSALLEHDDSYSTQEDKEDQCHSVSVFMHAGCSDSSDLLIDSTCHPKPAEKKYYYAGSQSSREAQMQNDQPPLRLRTEYTCHGQWSEVNPDHLGGGAATTMDTNHVEVVTAAASMSAKKTLMLSSGSRMLRDNSLQRQFLCLTYTEQDGVLWASATKDACTGPTVSTSQDLPSMQQLHHTYYPTPSSSGHDFLRDSAAASDEDYFNITSSGPCLQR